MSKPSKKRGFTLVEVLVASTISVLVFAQVATLMISSQRALHEIIADVEMTMTARELSEKMLFHLSNTVPGLTSATDVAASGVGISFRDSTKTSQGGIYPWQDQFIDMGLQGVPVRWLSFGALRMSEPKPFKLQYKDHYVRIEYALQSTVLGKTRTIDFPVTLPVFGVNKKEEDGIAERFGIHY